MKTEQMPNEWIDSAFTQIFKKKNDIQDWELPRDQVYFTHHENLGEDH